MKFWQQMRTPFLVLVGGSAFLVLGKLFFFPPSPYEPPLAFPEEVPLSGWQLLETRPLTPPAAGKGRDLLTGSYYRYRQGERVLEIEMRYLTRGDGDNRALIDVRGLLEQYAASPPVLQERQRQGVGFYGVGADQSQAYLSSCINPRGETTLTGGQFKMNRDRYDLQPNRLLSWLFGREPLRDNRCLWAHLSLPLKGNSPDTAYPILENAWFFWYKYWQPRFQNKGV